MSVQKSYAAHVLFFSNIFNFLGNIYPQPLERIC